jgi:hypothetical protein
VAALATPTVEDKPNTSATPTPVTMILLMRMGTPETGAEAMFAATPESGTTGHSA